MKQVSYVEPEEVPFEEETITAIEAKNMLVLETTTPVLTSQDSPSKENQNPMQQTNQFSKAK